MAHVWGDRVLDVRHLVASGAVGPVRREGDRILIGSEELALAPHERVDVPAGPTSWRLSYVEPQPRAAAGDFDWGFTRLMVCLLLLAAAAVAMFTLEVGLGFTDGDGLSQVPISYQRIVRQAPPPKKLNLPAAESAKVEKEQAASTKIATSRAQAPLKARTAGLLGILDGLDSARSLFEPGLSPGVVNAMNNLKGDRTIGEAHGLGGSRGPGGGNGDGLGLGPGGLTRKTGGSLAFRLEKGPDTGPCCEGTKVSDGLPKEVIARVIRRHFAEIKFCYEQGSSSTPRCPASWWCSS